VKSDAKVMTIEPASGAFMIKSVSLGERLVEIQRIRTFVRSRKSFVQTIQPAKEDEHRKVRSFCR
jgi:hypothetical protein